MGYFYGEDRNQIQFYTSTREEFIGEDNPVRVIDAFVEQLDIADLAIEHVLLPLNGTKEPIICHARV